MRKAEKPERPIYQSKMPPQTCGCAKLIKKMWVNRLGKPQKRKPVVIRADFRKTALRLWLRKYQKLGFVYQNIMPKHASAR